MTAMPRTGLRHTFRTALRAAVPSVVLASGAALCVAAPAGAQTPQPASQEVAETASDQYARILQQIDDTRVNIARREVMLARQGERIASLEEQIARLPDAETEITPILTRFAAGMEQSIESDIPFQLGERFERLSSFQELLGNADASLGEKMARALSLANVEATYGYEIVSYEGDHPLDARRRYNACVEDLDSAACALTDGLREQIEAGASVPQLDTEILDGDFVRYGRLSMAYVDKGTSDVLVWDAAANEWRESRGSEVAGIRRNLRVARGEAAPDVIEVPVVVTN